MKKLCVLLPTYNRAALVESYLQQRIGDFEKCAIDIAIFDSSEDELTKRVVLKFGEIHKNIAYQHLSGCNLSQKMSIAFRKCSAEYKYIWLIGDRILLNVNALIDDVNTAMNNGFDLIHVYRNKYGILSKEFDSASEFFYHFGWSMTHYSGFVVSSRIGIYVSQQLSDPIFAQNNQEFEVQMSIFRYIAKNTCKIMYINKDLYSANPIESVSSNHENRTILETWTKRWTTAIDYLPNYYDANSKNYVMKSLSDNIGLFSCRGLLSLRCDGNLTIGRVHKYRSFICKATDTNTAWFYIVALVPVRIITLLRRLKKRCLNCLTFAWYLFIAP